MTARLKSGIEVSGLIRRVEGLGGQAMVLARGDADAGAVLLLLVERGIPHMLLERALTPSGEYRWQRTGPQNIEVSEELDPYIERRRRNDGDLWLLELDVAEVERFAAEMISTG